MTARESQLDPMTRRLTGSHAVRDACDAAREFATALWLGDDELARLCIVVEEWVANLYDHGGLTPSDAVELCLASDPEGVKVIITDPGNPFDPRDLPCRVELPDRGGGAGIGIMRAWANLVTYQRTEGGNRLELLLPFCWRG